MIQSSSLSLMSAPALSLVSPAASPSKNLQPTFAAAGTSVGDTVNIYSDPTCTTLIASQSGSAAITNVATRLLYGTYNMYVQSVLASGQTTACSKNPVPYTASLTTGAGFPIGRTDASFYLPTGIIIDSAGNIFVGDYVNMRIQKYSSTGLFIMQFGGPGSGNGQFSLPYLFYTNNWPIRFDSSGNIWVLDMSNARVQKFDSNGNYLMQFGSGGSGDGQFINPWGMDIDSSNNIYVSESNNNRVQKFDSNGTFLMKFGSYGTTAGLFDSAFSVAVNSLGFIYVLDNTNRIQKFNSAGVYVSEFGTGGTGVGQFAYPTSLKIDSSDNIYTTERGSSSRVQKFDANGTPLMQINGIYGAYEVSLDPAGNIYVGETYYNRIEKFDSTGSFLFRFGATGTNNGEFKYPTSLATNSLGQIIVMDQGNQRAQIFDSDGSFNFTFGSGAIFSGNAYNVTTDSSDNIYVADAGGQLKKFNSSGTYLTTIGISDGSSTAGHFNSPQGVFVDPAGDIYVADCGNNRVQKFSSVGTYQMQFGTSGSGVGQFNCPQSLVVDGLGNIFVLDQNNNRVQKFSSVGTALLQFGSYGTADSQFGFSNSGYQQMAIDSSNNVYVADLKNSRIQKFDSSGALLLKIGTLGTANGQFAQPVGVAVDASGNIYVSDVGTQKIQKFNSAGVYQLQ